MSTDGGGIDEVAFALKKGRDVAEELPGEAIYPCEGILQVPRLRPDAGSL